MTPEDFDRLQGLMASRAGFALHHDRMQLAEHRLGPVARREGYHNVEALLAQIWSRPVGALAWDVIESLLNNETWFRRDRKVFDLCGRDLMPVLAKARRDRPVRIWCAGGGTGQEAYSLAMLALSQGLRIDILNTDLSARAVAKAQQGVYTGFEIQRGLPARTMLDWFAPLEDQWQAKDELRRCVRFARANLLDPLPEALAKDGPFDLIFCRYVLGDMVPDYRAGVLEHLAKPLTDDGCLFLGQGEQAEGSAFRAVAGQKGLFVKAPDRKRHAA